MMEELLKLYLPGEVLTYFEFCSYRFFCDVETKEEGVLIYLDEKNEIPDGFNSSEYESKGFNIAVTVQDFPIRGKNIFYSLRKRRWRHKIDKTEISRDFSFLATGIRMTSDLVAFLKDTGRDPQRYDKEHL